MTRDNEPFDATHLRDLLDVRDDGAPTQYIRPVTTSETHPDTEELEPVSPGMVWEGQSPAPDGFYDEAGSQARAENWADETASPAGRAVLWAVGGTLVATVVGLSTYIAVRLGLSADPDENAAPAPATTTAVSPALPPATTVASTSVSTPPPPPPAPATSTQSAPSWRDAPTHTFSWYGDGVSDVGAKQGMTVGTADTRYAWNVAPTLTLDAAIPQIRREAQEGRIDMFVIAFGATEAITADQLNRLADATQGRGLILVGTATTSSDALPWSRTTNDMLAKLADKREDTWYVDWQAVVDQDRSLVDDGFIPTKEGAQVWAWLINQTISEAYASLDKPQEGA